MSSKSFPKHVRRTRDTLGYVRMIPKRLLMSREQKKTR